MRNSKRLMTVVLTVALVALAGVAFAGWGMGPDRARMAWGGPGGGYPRGWMGPGHQAGSGPYGPGKTVLSEADFSKMNELRRAFFKDTESLREQLREKRLALKNEFAGNAPDLQKATALQEEISALRSDLDQKRIVHVIEMRKIDPNAGRGFMMPPARGKTRGTGRGPGCGYGSGPGCGSGYGWR